MSAPDQRTLSPVPVVPECQSLRFARSADIARIDLAAGPVLLRAADEIDRWGHVKGDFIDHEDGGYCAAGAIADASGIEADDWYSQDPAPCHEEEDPAEHARWLAGRAASLAALRTLLAYLYPDCRPEEMSRDALIVKVGEWNDDEDRTPGQVVEAMRFAARQIVRHW